jgi:hypothetical protein
VTGISEGVATISATLSGIAGSTTVQVRPVVRGSARPRALRSLSLDDVRADERDRAHLHAGNVVAHQQRGSKLAQTLGNGGESNR